MKKFKKLTASLLCFAMGVALITPMSNVEAVTTIYTRKKVYYLPDSAKIKKVTCGVKTKVFSPAKSKVKLKITSENKYTIKYVTAKNKRKTCYVYADWTKPTVSGVKDNREYENSVNIKVSDKLSGVSTVTLNGEKKSKSFTVSEAGDYKLVAKDMANNKTVVNFSIVVEEEETPCVITAEPNQEDNETPTPKPTETSDIGDFDIDETAEPDIKSTDAVSTSSPKLTGTPEPTKKATSEDITATATVKPTATVAATATVAPTEVPKKTYEVKVQVPQAWSNSTVYLYSYYTDSNAVKFEPNGTWANATAMTRDNSLSGYWYSAKITLPQGQTAYALVKNSNGQQRPEAQSQGYAVSGNTWVDLYGSVSSSKPSVVPTEVPATPTPVPDDLAELDANWDYKINVKEKSVTLNDYKGESTNVYVKKSYKIEGQDLKAVLAETVRKYGAYIPEHAEGPFAGHNGYSNAKIETVEFEDGFDFGESIDNLFWGNMFLTKVVGLKGNIKSMESTFRSCDLFNQNIEIPSTVTNMNNCFKDCKKFNPSSFSIPPLAETIAHAFENCESLNIKIAIPDSVVDGTSAFSGCKSLETMPTNTCSTGLKKYSYMFYNCSGIKNAYFHLRNFEEMISTFEGCSGFIKDEWGNYDFIIMGGYPADAKGFDVSNYKNIFKNCCKGEIKVNPGNTGFWGTLNSNENVKMYIYSNIYGCRQCDKK